MTGSVHQFVENIEAVISVVTAMVLYAIVAGPMVHLKTRYRLLMFCIATSILGASLNRFSMILSSTDSNDEAVTVIARFIIVASRSVTVLCGAYVFMQWFKHCNKIKYLVARKAVRMIEDQENATSTTDTDRIKNHPDITVGAGEPVKV